MPTEAMICAQPCFPCRKNPKTAPVRKAVSVKPGKYAPIGKSSAPMKSARAPTVPAASGPKRMAAITTGMKLKPILMFHALTDRKRDSTISTAVSRARVVSILVVKRLFDIRHAPSVTVCHERSGSIAPGWQRMRTVTAGKALPFVRRQRPIRRHLTRLFYSDISSVSFIHDLYAFVKTVPMPHGEGSASETGLS